MPNEGPLRFGVFEVDLGARELRKRGVRMKLQDQPFRVLEALLENPGDVVTREQLKERLWAQDEFVEFDKSLNTAVQKIRLALSESAESPRFLETVP
jgi:DNA-binding winged helix-turn-helix (wHTH) protein